MWLDIAFVTLLLFATLYGFRKGIVFMVFIFLGLFLGLVASLQLSHITASYLEQLVGLSGKWLPAISFIISFLLVFFAVKLVAKIIEGILKITFLNVFNRLIGAGLACIIGFFCLTTLIWYLGNLTVFHPDVRLSSKIYTISMVFVPTYLEQLGTVFPFVQSLLFALQDLFTQLATDNFSTNQ